VHRDSSLLSRKLEAFKDKGRGGKFLSVEGESRLGYPIIMKNGNVQQTIVLFWGKGAKREKPLKKANPSPEVSDSTPGKIDDDLRPGGKSEKETHPSPGEKEPGQYLLSA